MDSYSAHLNETLPVLAVSIVLSKNRWTEQEVKLTKSMQKSPVTFIRLDS